MAKEKAKTSGSTETTGHSWDGIAELNNPLPKWWLYTFYATIIWAIGYWIVYPAWPTVSSYTKGYFGYSQRERVSEDLAQSQAEKAVFRDKIAAADLEAIKADPELLNFALAGGAAAFGDNCAPCHGRGAQGGAGYPNLRDDAWLWGGTLDAIHQTIQHGIRAEDDQTHMSQMPAFGKLGMLKPNQVSDAAEFVMSLSGNADDEEAAARGKEIFATNCAACHGPDGMGNQALGAPNLTDQLWLYGGDKATIVETITNSRAGMMPAWAGRLDPATVKELAIYVHSLGGGQ
ncbi:MAG: cytochrome-c oxidase, cbb3-type subunit III [Methyloceanibacter sp.]|uniref:cytochrome-c oxidase, cbb3-type subunit III n=1 Tax=Methyloceanibacter sp. TaxID=1965321 RepID=UPI001E0F7C21|nr:cytochrome-c oxidase, cbb3-type subunit III [Methyloceanibacter sp.]MCB1441816.1 cytochrome-c oxidase, cbb3-type subunit III [Methyloceanibacter sp.]MCC0058594.1 cytochrome-c oxidase, cbb3-type subunit III [Hyphomicrobiaceae bacterium]